MSRIMTMMRDDDQHVSHHDRDPEMMTIISHIMTMITESTILHGLRTAPVYRGVWIGGRGDAWRFS